MSDFDQSDYAISCLYEAACKPERWPAAMSVLGDLLNAVSGQFLVWDKRIQAPAFLAFREDAPPTANEHYERHYGALDPRRLLVERMPVGTLIADHEHFDEAFVRRDEFYQDYLRPLNLRYAAGGRVLETPDLSAVVAVIRAPEQGPFLAQDMAVLKRLGPHLARAAQLHQRLALSRRENLARTEAVNRLPFGLLIVGADGRVLTANRAAERMVAEADGLLVRHGRLTAVQLKESAALAESVTDAVATAAQRHHGRSGGAGLRITRPSGKMPYSVLVAPLAATDPFALGLPAEPAALVLVTDPERRPAVLGRHLAELFGLTPAEARLAAALAGGRTLQEYAVEAGVSAETARWRLKKVLAKTGTARQADLVRLILSSPVVLDL